MGEIPFKDDIRPEPLGKALSERYLAYALSHHQLARASRCARWAQAVHRRILHAMRETGP